MNRINGILIFIGLLFSIACTDKKKEEAEMKEKLEAIEEIDSTVEEINESIEADMKELDEALKELDSL